MAGLGQRFVDAGYDIIKPLLPVFTKDNQSLPMVVAATQQLYPKMTADTYFVIRDHDAFSSCKQTIRTYIPKAQFYSLAEMTEGQAITCLKMVEQLESNQSILIGACDNGMIYGGRECEEKMATFDAIIWTFKGHSSVSENPHAYGWVKMADKDTVDHVVVKQPISSTPLKDHAIVGAFWFKSAQIYREATQRMITKNDRINNEFYVDSVMNHVIANGYKVTICEVDHYFCWGTPQQYESYQKTATYWQSYKKELLSE